MSIVFVSRYCKPDGTWASTNYKDCQDNLIKVAHTNNCNNNNNKTNVSDFNSAQNENECDETNDESERNFLKFLVFANFFGFSVAIIPLSAALFIFLSIR